MKYGMLYNKRFKYLNEIDELTIYYVKGSMELIDFLLNYEDKRINIYFRENKDLDKGNLTLLEEICKKYPQLNVYIKIDYTPKEENWDQIYNLIKNCSLPYYFSELVRDWETLNVFLELEKKPSDIYIGEQLGFEIKSVKERVGEDIKLRTYPNICQFASSDFSPKIKTFFIRPEDVEYYEYFFDTLEFYGIEDNSVPYADTLYKIYNIDKKWFGDLSEFIIGLDTSLDSRSIYPAFAEARSNCGRRCLKNGKCKICERTLELSELMSSEYLYFEDI